MAAPKKKKVEDSGLIVLDRIKMQKIKVRIKGLTDVITHSWSYKAKWEMLVKQMFGKENKLLSKKFPRCPLLDYAESLYWVNDKPEILNYYLPLDVNENTSQYVGLIGEIRADEKLILDPIKKGIFGFPAGGLKAAIVGACRLKDNLEMVTVKRLFHVEGFTNCEYIVFENEDGTPAQPYMKEDMVVIGNGIADVRFRGAFKNWFSTLTVTFNAEKFDANTMVNLIDAAGNGGIGEWRPAAKKTCSGNYGRFEVIGTPTEIKGK